MMLINNKLSVSEIFGLIGELKGLSKKDMMFFVEQMVSLEPELSNTISFLIASAFQEVEYSILDKETV